VVHQHALLLPVYAGHALQLRAALAHLNLDYRAERDAAILRSLRTLRTINSKPAADFWKEVDGK
jgi:hypothetical protein